MELKYFGHSCFSMTFENGTVLVTDPFDSHITYPPCEIACDAALVSHHHRDHDYVETLKGDFSVFDTAGNFELNGIKISAIRSWHDHHEGAHRGSNLLFRIEGDGLSIAHLGDLGHIPNDAQAKFLGDLDVLLVPIGGHYTIDHNEAIETIALLKPKTAIAMHYRTAANSGFDSKDVKPFAIETSAKRLPDHISITPDALSSMPKYSYMDYE